MGKYIVKSGQKSYDIAPYIYGAINGIVDIMINNPNLSFCDDLKSGDEHLFTDNYVINADVVAYFKMNNLTPVNGQRHVCYKKPT